MDEAKRERLEAAGCVIFKDAADLLGMDEVERKRLDLHIQIGNAVRRLRTIAGLTQAEFARRLKTSRPRVTDIELGMASLDQCVRALFALGGTLASLDELGHPLTHEELADRVVKPGPKRKPRAAGTA